MPGPRRPVPLTIGAALVSFASTLLGIGGGAFLVPLLNAWGGIRLKRSVATSLALITVVVAAGLAMQVIQAPQDILWEEAGLLVVGAIAGAPVGRWALRIIPRALFRYVMVVFFLLVALRMVVDLPETAHFLGHAPDIASPSTIVFSLVTGFIAGVFSTLFGVGGGIVIVPALTIAYSSLAADFSIARATSLAAIVPISAWGTFLHARKDNVEFKLIPPLLPLSLVFSVVGVVAAYWIHADALKIVFAVLLLLMCVKLIAEARAIAAESR
jgi:uncharacterized membrane protein YfcA